MSWFLAGFSGTKVICTALYYENGNKKYEGECKDDKRNGKGVSYYENGNIEYEGEYKDGKKNGSGVSYYNNGNKQYEGEWKDGNPLMLWLK